jgi:hypothetical protein
MRIALISGEEEEDDRERQGDDQRLPEAAAQFFEVLAEAHDPEGGPRA